MLTWDWFLVCVIWVVRDVIGVTLVGAIVLSYVLILAPAREHIESAMLL